MFGGCLRAGAAAVALAVLGHVLLAAGLAPSLKPLWVAKRTAQALRQAGIDPRNGVTPGPVAVAGFDEPSIIFALGARTELDRGEMAAAAISQGRPAVVSAAELKDSKRRTMRVHGRTGQPCPGWDGVPCGDTVHEVSFADSSLQYCPTCQTGGKPLADRRLSRLLR